MESCHEVKQKLWNSSSLLRYKKYVVPEARKLPSASRNPRSWAEPFDSPKSLAKSFSCAQLKDIGLFLSGIGTWYDADVPISSSSVSLSSAISMSLGTLGTGTSVGTLGTATSVPWGPYFLTGRISGGTTWCLFFFFTLVNFIQRKCQSKSCMVL